MASFGLSTSETDLQSIAALQRFIDEVGLYGERAGLPLQPLHRIAAGLGTTKGIIGLAAQPLVHLQIVELVSPPGDEHQYFRLRLAGWSRMVLHQLSEVAAFGALAEHGLALLADASPERRERLLHVRDLYASLESALPGLLEKWDQAQPSAAPPEPHAG